MGGSYLVGSTKIGRIGRRCLPCAETLDGCSCPDLAATLALLAPEQFHTWINTGGVATWTLSIPFLPAFVGTSFYTQGGVLVLGFNPGGLVFSNGIAHVVGG